MPFDAKLWTRLEHEGTPVYVRGDRPDWFVPNRAGDRLLQDIDPNGVDGNVAVQRFLDRLPDGPPRDYPGRAELLRADHLRELWFHVTNRCNLSCTHCLFASCPGEQAELEGTRILQLAAEAADLGCRVFALTGGEPFYHREIGAILEGLLAHQETQVVVLTNGTLLRRHGKAIAHWGRDRLHLQVSVDGLRANHDRIRGQGAFDHLENELAWLRSERIPFTVSMCVENGNVDEMPGVVEFAADAGASNVHFMWYFVRGRGEASRFVPPDRIFKALVKTAERAEARGVVIDNIEAARSQVFAPGGTKHDGVSAGWEAAAVGPDGMLYPSGALVGVQPLGTPLTSGLAEAWQRSAVLEKIRAVTAAGMTTPLRFIVGGGDLDHSYVHKGTFIGDDPYGLLNEKLSLWLIAREASPQPKDGPPRLRLKMGDVLESCAAHGAVALVHSNCLLALAGEDSRARVKDFYTEAVGDTKEEILNPVCYAEEVVAHVPPEFRFRGYGCGSPVLDADIREGEAVMDLGCGSGVACFVAAKRVGAAGKVIGIDMLDPMLDLARRGAAAVASNLGFDNMDFSKGYLEALPVEDRSVDVVLSNCVMNLSTHKRKAFAEIFRALRPGGRLVISDVVCETEPDPAIRNDDELRGQCIAGALRQRDLVGILEETGFDAFHIIKRFPYRLVKGHPFFSMTYEAHKPAGSDLVKVMYRGPNRYIVTSGGRLLAPGVTVEIPRLEAEHLGDQIFVLDRVGQVTNVDIEATCSCALPPEAYRVGPSEEDSSSKRHREGCVVCGDPLEYFQEVRPAGCSLCGREHYASAACRSGHYVCDACHARDSLEVIGEVALTTGETDMHTLLDVIRRHPAIPMHGPEYHAMVPAIVLATYRNLGGDVTPAMIQTAVRRGSQVPGGTCGFMGVCGAAMGVGIAFALLLESDPLQPAARRAVQSVTADIARKIGSLEAARCCLRECRTALVAAAEASSDLLPLTLKAEELRACDQRFRNPECVGTRCPFFEPS